MSADKVFSALFIHNSVCPYGKYIPTHVYLKSNVLLKESVVLLEQIRTIDKCRLLEYIGEASESEMNQIVEALRKSVDV